MIVFDLKCQGAGHVFEAWFGSSEDYEDQQRRGLVQCPICASPVEKAAMAPRVGSKGNRRDSEDMKRMLAAVAAVQKRMLENSEHVGDRFADEARAIHLGEAEARSIHGRTTRAESEKLIEEGIPVAPLPLPVISPGEEN